MGLLDGKFGIVFGGGTGIGKATAILFAKEGATVVVASRKEQNLKETVKEITDFGGKADYITADMTKEDEVAAAVDKVVKDYGKIDFAVNASGYSMPNAPVWERDADTWKKTIDIDLNGTFYAIKHETAYMVKQKSGSIVNISSGAGDVGCAGQEPYAAAKAAVNNLTKSAAIGVGPYGVRINAILPGVTNTPMIKVFAHDFPALYKTMISQIPLDRAAEPEEQAKAALFLVSDLASDVTGVLLKVDGGYQAGYYTKQETK